MGVSKNNGTPKSSILIGFSIINNPFWGIPFFGNIHMGIKIDHYIRITIKQPVFHGKYPADFFFTAQFSIVMEILPMTDPWDWYIY